MPILSLSLMERLPSTAISTILQTPFWSRSAQGVVESDCTPLVREEVVAGSCKTTLGNGAGSKREELRVLGQNCQPSTFLIAPLLLHPHL